MAEIIEEKINEETVVDSTVGTVKIASDVVGTIAGLAAAEVSGVAGMSGGMAGGIAELLGRKNLTKGIRVEVNEQNTIIDLMVIVEYGCNISTVAKNVQVAVKKSVEGMTGLTCTAVNVHVQGVSFPQKNAEE